MPTYITMAKWTQKGIEKIKESPNRLDAFKKIVQSAGGTVKSFHMVTGRYDIVVVVEAPDDAAVAKIALAAGSSGSITTETVRAFTEDEYRKVIASLP
jgi:uncharacterized protein with GYD domain